MALSKISTDYFEARGGDGVPIILLLHRENRFPIGRTVVTAAGVVEIFAADGVVEILGSPESPCSAAILKRLRTHHEGLLLVQVDPARAPAGLSEQIISARLFNATAASKGIGQAAGRT